MSVKVIIVFYINFIFLTYLMGCSQSPSNAAHTINVIDSARVINEFFINDDLYMRMREGKKVFRLDSSDKYLTFNVYARIKDSIKTDTTILHINLLTGCYDIDVPASARYQTTLQDGTKIWLNTLTTFAFHANIEKERYAQVQGECCIDISRGKPFAIQTNRAKISLQKGKMNVKAYHNEPAITTSVITGKGIVEGANDRAELFKGDEAKVKYTKIDYLPNQDPELPAGWTEGNLFFNETENCDALLKSISRWYNAKLTYEGRQGNCQMSGKLSLANNFSSIVKVFEASGFKIRKELKDGQLHIVIE